MKQYESKLFTCLLILLKKLRIWVLWMHVCLCIICMPRRPGGSIRSPEMIVRDGCESLCRCWELNMGPLKEQILLFANEPSLCPPVTILINNLNENCIILSIFYVSFKLKLYAYAGALIKCNSPAYFAFFWRWLLNTNDMCCTRIFFNNTEPCALAVAFLTLIHSSALPDSIFFMELGTFLVCFFTRLLRYTTWNCWTLSMLS